jgi:hypothetical protein
MFEEEISPEEMFRQFFGGGGGMGAFGPGFGMFTFPKFKGVLVIKFPTFPRVNATAGSKSTGEPVSITTARSQTQKDITNLHPSCQTH